MTFALLAAAPKGRRLAVRAYSCTLISRAAGSGSNSTAIRNPSALFTQRRTWPMASHPPMVPGAGEMQAQALAVLERHRADRGHPAERQVAEIERELRRLQRRQRVVDPVHVKLGVDFLSREDPTIRFRHPIPIPRRHVQQSNHAPSIGRRCDADYPALRGKNASENHGRSSAAIDVTSARCMTTSRRRWVRSWIRNLRAP